jgi:hypothetical protein
VIGVAFAGFYREVAVVVAVVEVVADIEWTIEMALNIVVAGEEHIVGYKVNYIVVVERPVANSGVEPVVDEVVVVVVEGMVVACRTAVVGVCKEDE